MADKLFPVVPDTGTPKAARLATEITGNPGQWVRLDCQHLRHVQRPVEPGELLECPTCPPSVGGGLASRRVLNGGMVRIQVRDDDPAVSGTGRVVSFELREGSAAR